MTPVEASAIALQEDEQRFVRRQVSWEQFKAIQSSFAGIPNVRLLYCEGVLEIVGIGKPHEAIRCLLAGLLMAFFEARGIEFFPSGTYSQVVPGVVESQSDLSYCLATDKAVPDLCIEIVITSGSPIKLKKYQARGVPEVWFWEDGTFAIYRLRGDDYELIAASEWLSDLDLTVLNRCLLMTSPLEAMRVFRQWLQGEGQ